jgi:hypothetical protein
MKENEPLVNELDRFVQTLIARQQEFEAALVQRQTDFETAVNTVLKDSTSTIRMLHTQIGERLAKNRRPPAGQVN